MEEYLKLKEKLKLKQKSKAKHFCKAMVKNGWPFAMLAGIAGVFAGGVCFWVRMSKHNAKLDAQIEPLRTEQKYILTDYDYQFPYTIRSGKVSHLVENPLPEQQFVDRYATAEEAQRFAELGSEISSLNAEKKNVGPHGAGTVLLGVATAACAFMEAIHYDVDSCVDWSGEWDNYKDDKDKIKSLKSKIKEKQKEFERE